MPEFCQSRIFWGFPRGVNELAMFVNVISATISGAMFTLKYFEYLTRTGVRTRTTTSFKMKGEKAAVTNATAYTIPNLPSRRDMIPLRNEYPSIDRNCAAMPIRNAKERKVEASTFARVPWPSWRIVVFSSMISIARDSRSMSRSLH